jgi:2-(1,2-epoxy-1,2-dihydrophenyl)acetyl-CoA isomerase
VARVVPAEELDDAVDEVAARLLAGSQAAQAAAKHLIRDLAEAGAEGQLRREAESIARLGGSPSGREGVAAFLEKRTPKFN